MHSLFRASDCQGGYNAPVFRYAGSDLNRFLADLKDADARLRAIESGIGRVEKTFGLDLVDYVNIVPYRGPDNALTLRGKSQVWFYIDALRSQSVAELRSMAEHETLHILVDRLGYTHAGPLKQWYADLMGYGLFSRERFFFTTTGRMPDPAHRPSPAVQPFFSFINEKNFIPGMSGGHSSDNLDEFSASFLHSLLYLDLLKTNLDKPDVAVSADSREPLNLGVRRDIRKEYVRTLKTFATASSARRGPFSRLRAFFKQCVAQASRVRLAAASGQ